MIWHQEKVREAIPQAIGRAPQILRHGIAKTLLRQVLREPVERLSTSGWLKTARAVSAVMVNSRLIPELIRKCESLGRRNLSLALLIPREELPDLVYLALLNHETGPK
jgi:hypothetical protein